MSNPFNLTMLQALSPILVVSVTILAVMLLIAFARHHRSTVALSVLGLNVALLSLYAAYQVGPVMVTPLLFVDGHTLLYSGFVLVGALAVVTLSQAYWEGFEDNREEYYLLLMLSTLGGLVLSASVHFASFFIGLELLSVPLYAMVGYAFKTRRGLEASVKYLVLSAAASALLLFGMAFLYSQTGTLAFSDLLSHLSEANTQIIGLGALLMFIAVAFKLSLAPFHLWTPDVYEGAPAPTTAYLASVAKIAVIAVLLRFWVMAGAGAYEVVSHAMGALALLSMILGNLLALKQNNLKRMLAYSSIAHFGYLLVGMVSFGILGIESVNFYVLTYLITTLAGFAIITLVSSPYNNQADADLISQYNGLFWKRPVLAAILTVTLLSLAGVPLTAGFVGKFYVFMAGMSAMQWWLLGALIVGSAISVFYYLNIMIALFSTEQRPRRHNAPLHWAQQAGGIMTLGLMLLMLVIGLYPQPLLELIQMANPR